jgi:hypothetical protein
LEILHYQETAYVVLPWMQQTVWVMEPLAVDSVQTPYLNLEGKNDINHTYNREQKINVTKTKQKNTQT